MEKVVQRVLMLDIMLVEVDGWIPGVTLIPKMLKNLWTYWSKVDNEKRKINSVSLYQISCQKLQKWLVFNGNFHKKSSSLCRLYFSYL